MWTVGVMEGMMGVGFGTEVVLEVKMLCLDFEDCEKMRF